MTIQTPTAFVATVFATGKRGVSSSGDIFLECRTSRGVLAFWGSPGNTKNIEVIESEQVPFVVRGSCIMSNWDRHDLWVHEDFELATEPERLRDRFVWLRSEREQQKSANRAGRRRGRLSEADRQVVLAKTGGRCHICGGEIGEQEWEADHVLAHSGGGGNNTDNYLPAHATCNNSRWDYLPEEVQFILKLGVWARTQVETSTPVGRMIEERFTKHEATRTARRRQQPGG